MHRSFANAARQVWLAILAGLVTFAVSSLAVVFLGPAAILAAAEPAPVALLVWFQA